MGIMEPKPETLKLGGVAGDSIRCFAKLPGVCANSVPSRQQQFPSLHKLSHRRTLKRRH